MMSPDRFALLDGISGHAGIAVADDLSILWCSQSSGDVLGVPRQDLLARRLGEALQRSAHADRIAELCRRVAMEGAVTLHEFWRGRRVIVRIWPLDTRAFGRPGAFIVILSGSLAHPESASYEFSPFSPDFGELSHLTSRELEVLRMLAQGMSDKAIAAELHRTKSTVETHVASILRKLKVDNRSAATRVACERGITAFTAEQWRGVLSRGAPASPNRYLLR
jgi:DNA-binding NarL/FixJ family response regulator